MPNWLKHELLRSDKASSVEVDGIVFFADGALAIAGDRAFQRKEAVNHQVLGCQLFRRSGSDVLRLSQSAGGALKSTWFLYEHDLIDCVYELLPDAPVPPDAMPPEPWKIPGLVIAILRVFTA